MERTGQSNPAAGEPANPMRFWVRELSTQDDIALHGVGTGDVLPDGTVVLREDDIDRMGLRSLRRWLAMHSLRPRHPIALVRRATARGRRDDDDEDLDS